jgi:hypothetical protein
MELFEKAEFLYKYSQTWKSWFLGIDNDILLSSADVFYESGLQFYTQDDEFNASKSMKIARRLYRYLFFASKKDSPEYLYCIAQYKNAKI